MLTVDRLAWSNRWSRHHPAERVLLAGGLLALSLVLPPLSAGPVILLTAAVATVAGAGVPASAFFKVMAVPAAFLLTGAPLLAVSLEFADGVRLGVSQAGLATAAAVTLRSLAAVASLTLLILTTPAVELLVLARRAGLPRVVGELMLLIYHLLFVLLERASAGRRAQAARQGYAGLRRSLRSLGLLAATLLQRALDRGRRLETGLAARGYDGGLAVLSPERRLSPRRLAAIAAVLLAVAAAGMLPAAVPAIGPVIGPMVGTAWAWLP